MKNIATHIEKAINDDVAFPLSERELWSNHRIMYGKHCLVVRGVHSFTMGNIFGRVPVHFPSAYRMKDCFWHLPKRWR